MRGIPSSVARKVNGIVQLISGLFAKKNPVTNTWINAVGVTRITQLKKNVLGSFRNRIAIYVLTSHYKLVICEEGAATECCVNHNKRAMRII